jgi:hypothetical protein
MESTPACRFSGLMRTASCLTPEARFRLAPVSDQDGTVMFFGVGVACLIAGLLLTWLTVPRSDVPPRRFLSLPGIDLMWPVFILALLVMAIAGLMSGASSFWEMWSQ